MNKLLHIFVFFFIILIQEQAFSQNCIFNFTVSENSGTTADDGIICSGSNVTLGTSKNYLTYLWSNGATTPTITISPAATTIYTVTVTGTACTGSSKAKTIVVNSMPTASIDSSSKVCRYADAFITFTGSGGTLPYTYTYKIDNGNIQTISTNNINPAVILPVNTSLVGNYDYILISVASTNGCSQLQPDTATITVKKIISAQLTGTAAVCQNDTSPLIKFIGLNGVPPYSFTYIINSTDTFTITTLSNDTSIAVSTDSIGVFSYNLIAVSDSTCSNNQNKFVTITVNSLPSATLNGTTAVCQYTTPPLITFIGSDGKPPYTFTYNTNGGADSTIIAGGSSITVPVSTDSVGTFVYNLTSVSDANGCSKSIADSVTITVNQLPDATISGTTSVCQNGLPPLITFNGNNGIRPYKFTYIIDGVTKTDSTTAAYDTVNVSVPTNLAGTFIYYLVSVSDANGCASSVVNQSATITVNPLPYASISGTTAVCQNDASPTVLFTGTNGTQNYTFTYNINGGGNQTTTSSGSNIATITCPTTTAGIYSYNLIAVSDSNGCSQNQTDSVTITVHPLPTADISGSAAACQNDSPPVITFTGNSGTAPFTFTYSIFDGINPVDTNTVTSNGTDSIKTVTASTNTAGTFVYHLVAVQDANGCSGLITDSVIIIVNPLPTATITGGITVCKDSPGSTTPLVLGGLTGTPPFTFIYNVNGNANDTLVTTSGSSNFTIQAPTDSSGIFVYNLITVIDSNGCSQVVNSQSTTVTVNPLPSAIISGTTSVCQNSAMPVVTFTGSNGTQPYTFTYNINGGSNLTISTIGSNAASVLAPTVSTGTFIYNLISVSDSKGCLLSLTDSVTIIVNSLPGAIINGTTVVCQNDSAPSITFTGSNGTPPYSFTYNINNGINSTITTSGINVSFVISAPTFGAGTFVYHLVAVTDANGCTQNLSDSITVAVNPLPSGNITVSPDSVCQNDLIQPLLTITGFSGTAPYTFTYNINGGSALTSITSGGNDSVQITVPTNTAPGIYNYNLTLVSDANGCSLGQSGSTAVTINPLPVIQNNLPALTLCNGDTINVPAFTSTVFNSTYSWTTTPDIGFGSSGTGNIPNLPVVNQDSIPLNAVISIKATSPFGCIGPDKFFTVTVNPKPILFSSVDTTLCSQQQLNYLIIPDFYGSVTFGWNSFINPLIISGNSSQNPGVNNIINDTLVNYTNTVQDLPYSISLIYTNGTNSCITVDTLNVSIKPAPPKPYFTSVLPGDTITLCAGSTNINFNISNPDTAISYLWQAIPSTGVNIGNGNYVSPNTVISFDATAVAPITIQAIADYTINIGACQDTSSMIVNIINSGDAFEERNIITKEPGHLLVYPDNTMETDSGYQWGYDKLTYQNNFNDTVSGPPTEIPDQVYQVFIPSSQFIKNDSLNVHDFAYWIMLINGECRSKVYYNGPYANKPVPAEMPDNTVGLTVFPNPAAEDINILLHGKIYGIIDAKIYSALGHVVFHTRFEKKQNATTQNIKLNKIPDGVYMLELISSDHQKVTSRFIVYH